MISPQQEFLRYGVGLGISHQVFANLRVHVVVPVSAVDGVKADDDAIGQFVLVVGMDQHPHRRRQVIDAMEVAFDEGAEVPQAGPHLFEGFGNAILLGLLGMLGLRGVEPRPVEPRQVFVVGARPVAQGLPFGICRVHGGQGVDDPLGCLRILDVVAQIIEHVILDLEVRLEVFVCQHGSNAGIEVVGFHELVVEIEWDRESVGDGPRRKTLRPQHGHVGCLDPERSPVFEADLAEGRDRRDREVSLGGLFPGGPGSRVVGIDFGAGGRTDVPSGRGHLIADVAVDQSIDSVVVEGAADEGVGNAVLNGAQVDMRQRRLGHGGDDAGDAGQLVGQRLVDHDVPGVGTFVRVHHPQKAVPFLGVQRQEVGVCEDVFVEHKRYSGFPEQWQLRLGVRKDTVRYVKGQVVLDQRHAGSQKRIGVAH